MKLRFLCANHRQWLASHPDQALHSFANSFETGSLLLQQEQWQEAFPYLGCAYETAEILMTYPTLAPGAAVEWFVHALTGLAQTLDELGRTADCTQVYQAAFERLRKEAAQTHRPELEERIYRHITRLNRDRRRIEQGGRRLPSHLALVESSRAPVVLH